ncbi:MAG: hypothetical protein AAB909_04950 [Patescibacteria group bacterium]
MKKMLFGLLVFDLVLVNVGVGYLIHKLEILNSKSQINSNTQTINTKTEYVDQCGEECKEYIDVRIAGITPVPTQKVISGTTVIAPTRAKVRSTSYTTISSNGYSTSNDWQGLDSTGFYFDTRDYPGLVEVYFEANMKLFNGNGIAYVRLYDSTHGVGVQGSEVQTSSQADTLVTSGKLTFWSGKNLIRVQAKSLTADTAVFSSGRLRIVTEN